MEQLEEDVNERIQTFREKRQRNKNVTVRVTVITSFLAAITTVLVGASSIWIEVTKILNTLALLASATIAVVTAWDGLFNHKTLWAIYTEALNDLYSIKSDIKHLTRSKGEISQDVVDDLYRRYNEAVAKVNQKWSALRVSKG